MLGISPNGYPIFVSSHVGRTSDKKLTNDYGIPTLFEEEDQLMADRVFDIEGDLPVEVTLNIPAFLNGRDQPTLEKETSTRNVASAHVHVERAISRIKNYRTLHQVVPLAMAQDLENIMKCLLLFNITFPPLIDDKMSQDFN